MAMLIDLWMLAIIVVNVKNKTDTDLSLKFLKVSIILSIKLYNLLIIDAFSCPPDLVQIYKKFRWRMLGNYGFVQ